VGDVRVPALATLMAAIIAISLATSSAGTPDGVADHVREQVLVGDVWAGVIAAPVLSKPT
jgi:hypothetical protein